MPTLYEHLDQGKACAAQGRHVDALTEFRAVLYRFDPEHVEALYLAGVSEHALGRDEDAARTWRRVLELEPGHAGAREGLAALAARAAAAVKPPPEPDLPAVPTHDIETALLWSAPYGTHQLDRPIRDDPPPPPLPPPAAESAPVERPFWLRRAWRALPHPLQCMLALGVSAAMALGLIGLVHATETSSGLLENLLWYLLVLPLVLAAWVVANLVFLWTAAVIAAVPDLSPRALGVTFVAIAIYQILGYSAALFCMIFGPVGYAIAVFIVLIVGFIRPIEFARDGLGIGLFRAILLWLVVSALNVLLLGSLMQGR